MRFCALLWAGLVVLASSVGAQTNSASASAQVRIAQRAPAFELALLEGGRIRLADLNAPAVVVCFWLPNNKPCQRQLDLLAALQARFTTNQVQMIGVLVESDVSENLKQEIAQRQLRFPVARHNVETIEGFGGLTAVPTTVVIDHNRNVIGKYVGLMATNVLQADLTAIVKAHETPAAQ